MRARHVAACLVGAGMVAVSALKGTLATAGDGQAAARDGLGKIREDLRAGRYEGARHAADLLGRRGGPRAAVLAAEAERHLGLLLAARRRAQGAELRTPGAPPPR